MKRYLIIILILITTIILTSCQKGPDDPKLDSDFHVGFDGLEMKYTKNAPPDELYENSPFKIIAYLHNKGAYDISNGVLTLTIEDDYMETNERVRSIEMDGKSIFNPEGDYLIETFDIKAKEIEPLSETHTSKVILTGCYDYKTDVSTAVCIDTDVYDLRGENDICEVKDIVLNGQGAPIGISKIETKILPDEGDYIKPQFIIHVKNSGKGTPIDRYRTKNICSASPLGKNDWNRVILSEVKFSNDRYVYDFNGFDSTTGKEKKEESSKDNIKCTPNPLTLVNNEGYIRCTVDDKTIDSAEIDTFETQLHVKFIYGYTISESRDVKIKRIITH